MDTKVVQLPNFFKRKSKLEMELKLKNTSKEKGSFNGFIKNPKHPLNLSIGQKVLYSGTNVLQIL